LFDYLNMRILLGNRLMRWLPLEWLPTIGSMPRKSAGHRVSVSGAREGSSIVGSVSSRLDRYAQQYLRGAHEVWHGNPVAASELLERALDWAVVAGHDEWAEDADPPGSGTDFGDVDGGRRIRWLLGVALGATGRYGAALEVLAPLSAVPGDPCPPRAAGPYPALAAAAVASIHRQLGRHACARLYDEAGLRCAGEDVEASFDCTLGLAADAVGLGERERAEAEFARAAALLDAAALLGTEGCQEAGPAVPAGPALPDRWARQRVRLAWVRTELALLGDLPQQAVMAGREAVWRAEAVAMPRHLAKSLLFLGVALRQAGSVSQALATLQEAAALAEVLGARPLRWPALRVVADILAVTDLEASRVARSTERVVIVGIADELPCELREEWLTEFLKYP
jgi:tetratricopeptide (TPR) repeat protein